MASPDELEDLWRFGLDRAVHGAEIVVQDAISCSRGMIWRARESAQSDKPESLPGIVFAGSSAVIAPCRPQVGPVWSPR